MGIYLLYPIPPSILALWNRGWMERKEIPLRTEQEESNQIRSFVQRTDGEIGERKRDTEQSKEGERERWKLDYGLS